MNEEKFKKMCTKYGDKLR